MDKKQLKRAVGVIIPLAVLIIGISYNSYIKMHTFTLSGDERVKSEQIQPVTGRVKVTGTTDTDVVFTDIESGETYLKVTLLLEQAVQLNLKEENGTGLKVLENLR